MLSFCIGCQIPVKSELVRQYYRLSWNWWSRDIIKSYVLCATATTWFYLYFHSSCGFIFTGAQVNLHWRWHTFDTQITWLIQPRGKKKPKQPTLFGQIDFLNQFTAGWHKPDARKGGGERKKGVAMAVPGLQQSWLGSNQQILWTTLNCSFSKQTYRRVKKKKTKTLKLIAMSLRTIWVRKTSGFPKHQYFKYKCTLLPFYTGSELNFITSFMVGLCRPEQKVNNLQLLFVAEHYCTMLPHSQTRSIRDSYLV